ncbi:MAG: hypothetical protein UT05_C0003G0003 [Parcubacteria group bacterium GW2011_GWF2_38_76]|nr:MAG: hypothetical protein UT05_C0003G0003 [Parcubacteria group bacterium GW2011_GWF2_38_76]HBM46223.1 hypothetical protein [Patescibacteria group bacterium]
MTNNRKIIIVATVLLIAIGSFYAGVKYSGLKKSGVVGRNNFNRSTQMAQVGGALGQKGMREGGIVGGEVISKDAESITVKLGSGGSKIVFISSATPIAKSVTGTVEDIIVGGQVSITGDQNPDGSVTAKSVQIRK